MSIFSAQNNVPTTGIDENRALLMLQLTAIGWLLAKLIGWKLWVKDRLFPLAPVMDEVNWSAPVHYLLFAISLILIIWIILFPRRSALLYGLIVVEMLACVADQNRWQPWEYQYLFTTGIFLLYQNNPRAKLIAIAFMMACTYLYSGLGKLNEGYLFIVWDNMLLKRFFHLNPATIDNAWLHYSGYATAAIELLAGAGLLFSSTRKLSACLLLAMHIFLLLFLGPLGLNYNIVVWPWNIYMMVMLYLVFLKKPLMQFQLSVIWKGWGKLILISWGFLPALNMIGWWDHYLSAGLYSGKITDLVLCVKDSTELKELYAYKSKKDLYQLCDGIALINVHTWAMKEMNVPPYPEMRVYKALQKTWLKKHPGSQSTFVFYRVVSKGKILLIEE